MMAVSRAPTIRPRKGLEKWVSMPVKAASSFRGATEELMASMPNMRTAKPRRIVPIFFFLDPSLLPIRKMMPIAARTGVKEEGFRRLRKILELLIPVRDRIQEVTVVPILAPMMTPTAWFKFMMPELTKPTTMTVVAEEDWMTAVTKTPSRRAIRRFWVSFSRIFSRRPPERRTRPSPIVVIP